MGVELHPHQTKAVKEMHNGSILKGGVGVGKSITALAYYYIKVGGGMPKMPGVEYKPMKVRKDIYIFTTAKKRNTLEWEAEGAKLGLGRASDQHGVQLHVDSWNNIGNYDQVTDAFIIFDEQRLVGNGAWVKSFHKLAKNNQWIVLSATPGDTWMDYVAIFIANGYYKNRAEFIKRHVVYSRFSKYPKIERYDETGHLEKLRRSVLVEMPYFRHTKRHMKNHLVSYDEDIYKKVVKERWNVFTEEPIKDAAEMFITMRKVNNSHPSRLEAVKDILKTHPRLIIFYNFNYELEALRTLDYPIAEWNGQKHQEVPTTDKWVYLVQYTAGAEGWNCITTDATVFYSLNYSYKIFEQAQGRIDRLNTPYTDLHYYVLRSTATIDQMIMKAIKTKKTFNEKVYYERIFPDAGSSTSHGSRLPSEVRTPSGRPSNASDRRPHQLAS